MTTLDLGSIRKRVRIRLSNKKLFEKSIAMLDRKIDSLVYQLYGLTDDEIRIVEGVDGNQVLRKIFKAVKENC